MMNNAMPKGKSIILLFVFAFVVLILLVEFYFYQKILRKKTSSGDFFSLNNLNMNVPSISPSPQVSENIFSVEEIENGKYFKILGVIEKIEGNKVFIYTSPDYNEANILTMEADENTRIAKRPWYMFPQAGDRVIENLEVSELKPGDQIEAVCYKEEPRVALVIFIYQK